MLEQVLLGVVLVLSGVTICSLCHMRRLKQHVVELSASVNLLDGLVKKLVVDNQRLQSFIQNWQKLSTSQEAKPLASTIIPPAVSLSTSVEKPFSASVTPEQEMSEPANIPILAINPSSVILESEEAKADIDAVDMLTPLAKNFDFQEQLRQVVNHLLQQQARINVQQIRLQLEKISGVSPDISIQTQVYYLDGTPSDALAELIVISCNQQYYVVPHPNSFSNPYLSRWFEVIHGSQIEIGQWPVVSCFTDTQMLNCVQKGTISL